MRVRWLAAGAVWALASGMLMGCGLIDSDVLEFDLALPPQMFQYDTSRAGLPTSGTLPTVPCTSDAMCQVVARNATPNPMACGTTGSCEARIDIQSTVPYDLKNQSDFAALNDRPIVDVTVSKIEYELVEDTLTFATPPIGLYVAAQGVTEPGLGMKFGVIEAVAVGTKPGRYAVKIDAAGKKVLADTFKNWKTPFNLLVKTETPAVFKAGDEVPRGKISVIVHVTATASP